MKLRILVLFLIFALLLGGFTACGRERTPYVPSPVMVGAVFATYEFGIVFNRGNALLRDQVWAALQVLSANGTVADIAHFWFGYDPTFIPPNPYATRALGEVRERTLIVGFDPGAAPNSFFNSTGDLVGFDIDLAQAVADYFGWTVEFLPIRWADREFELQSGNIDALWGGATLTEQVSERLYHTPPYMENRQVFVTMSDSGVRNLRGLRNGRLAFLSASGAEQALIENESFRNSLGELVPEELLYAALTALEAGDVDAVLMNEVAAAYYIRTRDTAAFGGRTPIVFEVR